MQLNIKSDESRVESVIGSGILAILLLYQLFALISAIRTKQTNACAAGTGMSCQVIFSKYTALSMFLEEIVQQADKHVRKNYTKIIVPKASLKRCRTETMLLGFENFTLHPKILQYSPLQRKFLRTVSVNSYNSELCSVFFSSYSFSTKLTNGFLTSFIKISAWYVSKKEIHWYKL